MRAQVGAALMGALLLACCSGAPLNAAPVTDNTVRLSPSRLKLPQNIGPLRYNGQRKFDDRRLGRAYLFNASGLSLSLYVYDFGIAGLPAGPDSIPACEQYESAKSEIESGRNYDNVRLVSEHSRPLSTAEASLRVREARYELDRNGIHATSVLWLTAVDGYFLKMRLSLRAEVADEIDEARLHILEAIAQAITKSVTAPREKSGASAAVAPEASVEVDSHYDEASAALWRSYGVELVKWSRERPAMRPACGGLLVPDFAAELAARRAALAAARLQPEHARPAYWTEVGRIDEAGFLDEYVWQLRASDVPAASSLQLDLAGFEAFRARELPRHLVQSGARVRIHTVRELPSAD